MVLQLLDVLVFGLDLLTCRTYRLNNEISRLSRLIFIDFPDLKAMSNMKYNNFLKTDYESLVQQTDRKK